jgi:hypothetical protein
VRRACPAEPSLTRLLAPQRSDLVAAVPRLGEQRVGVFAECRRRRGDGRCLAVDLEAGAQDAEVAADAGHVVEAGDHAALCHLRC